jgi:hypothetical protein
MLGSAIGKGDGDGYKKKRRKRFDEQYLKGVGTGPFRDHNAWN